MPINYVSNVVAWARNERGGVGGTILAVAVVIVIIVAALIAFLVPNGEG